MKTRVYVSGPISKGDLQTNIDAARTAGLALLKAGFAPFVPHLTCYLSSNTPEVLPAGTTAADWYSADLPWVAVSQAVLRLPGESVGADLEAALAYSLGIPVFYSVADVIAFLPCEAS